MHKMLKRITVIALLGASGSAGAEVIDFTGGTVHLQGGSTAVTTTGYDSYFNADYYVENGFKLDFIGDFEHIGDYYGVDSTGDYNDVIHGHWAPLHGNMTAIEITKVGGGTFDLNYFILTSNTEIGGGSATGNELTYIEAWAGGLMTHRQLLAPDSWGWNGVHNPGPLQNDPQVYLGSEFDAVDLVRFTADTHINDVYCFGMDEFYIDEDAPPSTVPEPGTLILLSLGMLGLAGARNRKRI